MYITISSVFITLCITTILIIILNILLTHKKSYKLFRTDFLFIICLIVIIRLCLPIEMHFTITLPSSHIMNLIYDFLNYPLYQDLKILHGLMLIWFGGVVVQTIRYIHKIIQAKKTYEMIKDHSIVYHVHDFLEDEEIPDYPVYVSDAIYSPMVLGLNKTILLPNIEFTHEELRNIIYHELQHIQNKDIHIKQFINILTILYWWFPLVYVLRRQISLFLEIRVDDTIGNDKNKEQPLQYAQVLINVQKKIRSKQQSQYPQITNFLISENTKILDYRIQYLIDGTFKRKTNIILLCFSFLLPLFTNAIILEPYYQNTETTEGTFTLDDIKQESYIIHHKDDTYSLCIDGQLVEIDNPFSDDFKDFPIIEE